MTVELGALLGGAGLLIGILAGRFDIKRGQREALDTDVKASKDITEHIKELSKIQADDRIRAHGLETIGLRFENFEDRFDRHEASVATQFTDIKETLENGLAARIAKQVHELTEAKRVYNNEPGPQIPVGKTRKRPGRP